MSTEKPRYSITLEPDLFEQVETFRFDNRYQTRNQATIALIRLGLEAVNIQKEREPTDKPSATKE